MTEPYFLGYIELNYKRGIQSIEIRRDGKYVNVWIDEDLADDIDTKSRLAEYGDRFYITLDDYRKGIIPLTLDDVWPNIDER